MTRDQWQDRFAKKAVELGCDAGEAAALAIYEATNVAQTYGRNPADWPDPESVATHEMSQ